MRSLRFFGFLALLLVVVVGTTSALGQGFTTGSLTGKVESENAGLPGVTVAVSSPNLQGTRQTVTSSNGGFTFSALPPGTYTVTFTLSGFQTLTKSVTITAGQPAALDVNLTLSGVQASAVVTAKSGFVSTTTQASTTITFDEANKLPIGRTIAAAASISSGVAQITGLANALTISGAPTFDNLYTVDGAVITDNIRATPNNLFIEDAIQEVSTSVNAISAEYGRFQGGVINTVTKSGGNAFSGSFRTTFTDDAWSAVSPAKEVRVQDVLERYEATLGGPIWKDRIWFFGGFRSAKTSQAQVTFADAKVGGQTPVGGYPGTPFQFGDSEKRYQGKLTLTPFPNHTLAASYMKINDENANYVYPAAGSVLDTAGLITRQLPQDTMSITYNGVLTTDLFLEGMFSNRHFSFENSGSLYTDLVGGTILRDRSRSNYRYNAATFCGVCGPEKRDNQDILVKGSYFLSTGALGSHNIVLGYDNFDGKRYSNNYQSGSNYRIFTTSSTLYNGDIYPVIGSNAIVYYTPIFTLTQGTNTRTNSAFVNDQWRLNDRLSFNLGVRYDKNDAKNSVGATTANDSAFSPRIAANFDVTGKGNLRVAASYAHYVGGLQDSQQDSASSGGQPATFEWYYAGPNINVGVPAGTQPPVTRQQAITQVFNWFFAQGCPDLSTCSPPLIYASVPGLNRQILTTLKSPYAREYTVGFNGNVGSSFSYRADFVRRDFHDFYNLVINQQTGFVSDVTGKKYDNGIVGNTNDVDRNYTGLQTQFQYRWNWLTLGANWTWSHTLGSFDGENATSGPIQNDTQTYPEYKQVAWYAPYGSMATDQRHRVRLLASADLPFIPKVLGTFNLGLVQAYDTGAPYGAVGAVRSYLNVTNPGYITRPASVTYWYTARDAFRTDDIKRTDLALTYTIKLFNTVELFVQPQVINAFNAQGLIAVDTTVRTAVSPGTGNTFQNFNPFTTTPVKRPTGDTTVTTANWDYGPNFGKARTVADYQQPRTFLVTAGFRF
jgi:outer membrane receptor for ferrienterochelin and colicin